MHNFEDMPMPSFCDSPESVERFAAREPDAP